MCELYCGKVPDEEKWDAAQIGHYIGIGMVTRLLFLFYGCMLVFISVVFVALNVFELMPRRITF